MLRLILMLVFTLHIAFVFFYTRQQYLDMSQYLDMLPRVKLRDGRVP